MTTLLEISDDARALASLIEESESDGELDPIIDAWLAENERDLEKKLDGYATICREWTLRAAARREEAERLLLRVRVDENNAKRLKDRLRWFFESHGLKKVETERFKLSLCANGGRQPISVDIPPERLPDCFKRIVTTVTPDVEALVKALTAGEEVRGVRLEPRGSHIRIA